MINLNAAKSTAREAPEAVLLGGAPPSLAQPESEAAPVPMIGLAPVAAGIAPAMAAPASSGGVRPHRVHGPAPDNLIAHGAISDGIAQLFEAALPDVEKNVNALEDRAIEILE